MDVNAMDDNNSDVINCTCFSSCHLKHQLGSEGKDQDLNKDVSVDKRISVKEYPCKNGCGTMIRFDNNKVSDSGKHIPLNRDGTPHIWSKAPNIPCRFCACEIFFERTSSGKWIAHNPDGSFHECPGWPFKEVNKGLDQQSSEETG